MPGTIFILGIQEIKVSLSSYKCYVVHDQRFVNIYYEEFLSIIS